MSCNCAEIRSGLARAIRSGQGGQAVRLAARGAKEMAANAVKAAAAKPPAITRAWGKRGR